MFVDYRCTGCGAVTEVAVERPAPAERPCPRCGATARRVFGSFSQPGRAKRVARDHLDREQAVRAASPPAPAHSHDHGHSHGHSHGGHDHGPPAAGAGS
jgi:putative FmdB family regulatory protein